MSEFAKRIAPQTVRIERVLPGPIERVWDYLTDPEKRGRWFAGGALEPRIGGTLTLHFRHGDLSDEPPQPESSENEVTTTATVTEFAPPHRFRWDWHEADGTVTDVLFELEPAPDGKVRFIITPSRLPTRDFERGVAGGWHAHTDILEDVLLNRAPRWFWKNYRALRAEYDRQLGN